MKPNHSSDNPAALIRDPWYKASHPLNWQDVRLTLDVPHDVFSTLRIDEGTELLLSHLPKRAPKRVLDLGCGYGALTLPIAGAYPDSEFLLVDRDLLAVKWSGLNALKNGLSNVKARGSLGFRDLDSGSRFDWVLCNVPARIGKPFIRNILLEGSSLLAREGELRIVVIRDLMPVVVEIATETGLLVREIAVGPRHTIYAIEASESPPPQPDPDLYLRDQVRVEALTLDRPFDLGGDDPKRLSSSLPLLLDTLPRQTAPGSVLVVRSGYGALSLACRSRWKNATITAFDRDLLAADFTQRNDLKTEGKATLDFRLAPTLGEALRPGDAFDLVLLEVSPPAGEAVFQAEIAEISAVLSPGGRALVVAPDKIARSWVQAVRPREGLNLRALASRAGFTVFELA